MANALQVSPVEAVRRSELLCTQAYVAGRWVNAAAGRSFAVHNPGDGTLLATVTDAGVEEARHAIDAACGSQEKWRFSLAGERAKLLRAWFELIRSHREELAILITLEEGKPLAEARAEVDYGAAFVEWFAEEAKRMCGDIAPASVKGRRVLVLKEPVGVVAAITPWNFPLAMITRKVAPALAAGCAVIVKPAEQTPLSALALAELAARAGFPTGVLNVLPCAQPQAVAGELLSSTQVRKLSFTGSTEVGKRLAAKCAASVKRISLELGGNAPFVVFDDADLDAAVDGAMVAKFRASGESCIAANRFLVQRAVLDAFTEKLLKRVNRLKVGSGLVDDVDVGPLINREAVVRLKRQIDAAVAGGARILCGGSALDDASHFFAPTVVADVSAEMRLAQEELFGPVVAILPFEEEADALQIANATRYGLASYFYTGDLARGLAFAERLEFGMVGVNCGMISGETIPFGGIKESGLGREGSHYGIDEYLSIKYIALAESPRARAHA